jgi:hypothetical protein
LEPFSKIHVATAAAMPTMNKPNVTSPGQRGRLNSLESSEHALAPVKSRAVAANATMNGTLNGRD